MTIHSVRGGGGFGRRLSNEYVYEAALISQRVGLPVKVQWSREDDMAFDYFRSALYLDMEGGVSDEGRLAAWKLHVIAGSADEEEANYGGTYRRRDFPEKRVPHYNIATTLIPSQTPTGAWRAPFSIFMRSPSSLSLRAGGGRWAGLSRLLTRSVRRGRVVYRRRPQCAEYRSR